ncbi:calcium-binding protein [Nitrosomonas sp. JL21]|uniref:calcium-binding protein n=1 Tax=Nitrosomonas sp. JL21 TaxID=153949 RepID=UPI00136CFB3D|nr:calcium-binding protein [Nitrosomonas sp. JL21]MBL8497733.1 hypothetical protein [Nitrosomonas sp.]MCC7090687.1 hypothetical protein [Nitrosomonas sp.]MXS78322.1 calcium-binding protein [Nitrosomonas sp. JL21]
MAIINGTRFNDNNSQQYNGVDFQLFAILNGTANADTINGLAGDDVINGQGGNDNALGGLGNDLISGNAGDDVLSGGDGHDKLLGGAGNDNLNGNVGDDILNGGIGRDTLFGAAGKDKYLFDTAAAPVNADKINGYVTADDTIWLDDTIFSNLDVGVLDPENFVKGADVAAADANDFVLYDTASGDVSYDQDGNGAGAAVVIANLTGAPALSVFDFVVV